MDQETIFESKDGNLSIRTDPQIILKMQIPQNRSVFSFIEARFVRALEDGCQVKEDGWVYYQDGTKAKWFGPQFREGTGKGFYVWEPKLSDKTFLPKLENLRWKIIQYRNKQYQKLDALIQEIHHRGVAFAECRLCPDNCFHRFKAAISNYGGEKFPTIELGYHEGKGQKPENLVLGNAYYQKEKRTGQYQNWVSHLTKMLERMIQKFILPMPSVTFSPQVLSIQINGRSYWYQKIENHKTAWWTKLVYAEEDLKEIVV